MEDDDELYEIRRAADSFGVMLDSQLLADAEADLEHRPRSQEADDSEQEISSGPQLEPGTEDDAIEALFAHLED